MAVPVSIGGHRDSEGQSGSPICTHLLRGQVGQGTVIRSDAFDDDTMSTDHWDVSSTPGSISSWGEANDLKINQRTLGPDCGKGWYRDRSYRQASLG